MRNFCLALLVAGLIPAVAFAGGGGTKPTSTLRVKNLGANLLGVIVDPPAGFAITTLDAFRAAGGKTLNSGETATFKVKEGTHSIQGAFVDNAAGAVGNQNATVGKNKTVNLQATGAFPGAPVLQIK